MSEPYAAATGAVVATPPARIIRAEAFQCDVPIGGERQDAIQQFAVQETIFVELETDDGAIGLGFAYTIGTGGRAVVAHLRHDLLPALLRQDPRRVEHVWQRLFWLTHATVVGPTTSLALAAIDTALWDLRCRRAGLPLWLAAGGAQDSVPLYDTDNGWLQRSVDELVQGVEEALRNGLAGFKLKVGKPDPIEDVERVAAVRAAAGPRLKVMTDANQALTCAEAIRLARLFEPHDVYWLEEPLPAEDLAGHTRLAAATTIPIAVGESLYSPAHFREYLAAGATGIVQVDVARIGGITPWLKTAHLAETFNVKVAPHALMDLHVSLAAAVPNGAFVEHLPHLEPLLSAGMRVEDGRAIPPDEPGLGLCWDRDAIDRARSRQAP